MLAKASGDKKISTFLVVNYSWEIGSTFEGMRRKESRYLVESSNHTFAGSPGKVTEFRHLTRQCVTRLRDRSLSSDDKRGLIHLLNFSQFDNTRYDNLTTCETMDSFLVRLRLT